MNMEEQIKKKVEEFLAPEYFELENESHHHAGHSGDDGSGQTHFKLKIVSSKFEGCNRIQRHRLVHTFTNELMDKGLHALSLHLYTPAEHSKK